ncbi:MAG TPA: ATP-binding protein, partial [Xanthomonadales bacterium]|nr:ATP-binding protein [Xanthomonadales bacterium]
SDDQRRRAFDRFYRASGDGAGLGLAMVQRIARLHAGEVKLIDGLGGRGLGVKAAIRSEVSHVARRATWHAADGAERE